jgi:hypothetical protein
MPLSCSPDIGASTTAEVYGAVVWGATFGVAHHSGEYRAAFVVGGIIASFPATFATLYSGVALATVLARKLDGVPVTAGDGWRAARERIGIIGAWTLLVCTVGAILRLLEEYLPLGGRIFALVAGIGWALATAILVIPAVILIVAGFAAGGAVGIVLLALGGAGLLAVAAYSTALNQVYRVFLYRSAVADPGAPASATGPFSAEDLANPFRPRRSRLA